MRAKLPIRARIIVIASLAVVAGMLAAPAHALPITTTDILLIPETASGSGNGTLDMRLFTFSGAEIPNSAGTFNGDNGNNTLPNAGGSDTYSFAESYVTTGAELKAYYNLNFPAGSIDEIVLFLDLNETGTDGKATNTLAKLDVVRNPTTIQGSPNPFDDVSSAEQAAINQIYSGGTTIAWLDPQPAANLPIMSQGAGFADYAVFTGINPFTLNDGDVLLFNISMNTLNDGAEEWFLSGKFSAQDIEEVLAPPVPEPMTATLFASGLAGLVLRWRKRRLTQA